MFPTDPAPIWLQLFFESPDPQTIVVDPSWYLRADGRIHNIPLAFDANWLDTLKYQCMELVEELVGSLQAFHHRPSYNIRTRSIHHHLIEDCKRARYQSHASLVVFSTVLGFYRRQLHSLYHDLHRYFLETVCYFSHALAVFDPNGDITGYPIFDTPQPDSWTSYCRYYGFYTVLSGFHEV
jgi:hypothetical protein